MLGYSTRTLVLIKMIRHLNNLNIMSVVMFISEIVGIGKLIKKKKSDYSKLEI